MSIEKIFESFKGESEIAMLVIANMIEGHDIGELLEAQYLFNKFFYEME